MCTYVRTYVGNTVGFEELSYTADESVGQFTQVRLAADQPFAEATEVEVHFEHGTANGMTENITYFMCIHTSIHTYVHMYVHTLTVHMCVGCPM